jgi:hypothetical protein
MKQERKLLKRLTAVNGDEALKGIGKHYRSIGK